MEALPDGFDTAALAPALIAGWGIRAETLEYAPLGFGSYHWNVSDLDGRRHFVTVDDLDRKPWLGSDRDSTFAGLTDAFDAAAVLRTEVGLEFVIAPVPGLSGESTRRIGDRHSMAVFPYVDGRSGHFGQDLDRGEPADVIRMLARLHDVDPANIPLRVDVLLPGREGLELAMVDPEPWHGGPYSNAARRWLAAQVGDVRVALERLDRLSRSLAGRGHVITHGEPHPGNVMRGPDGLVLIDWDTVALAPPERDLWLVATPDGDEISQYVEATGRTVDVDALAAYRLAWDLADVASYVHQFRAPHQDDADAAQAWSFLSGTRWD